MQTRPRKLDPKPAGIHGGTEIASETLACKQDLTSAWKRSFHVRMVFLPTILCVDLEGS